MCAAKNKQHSSDLVIVLLLFFTYAVCALMLCVLGANFYSQTVAVVQEGFNQRTGVLYVTQKVHQSDVGGGVRVDSYEGSDALVLTEQETGQSFETWIFIHDNWLCEQLIQSGGQIIKDQAQRIMPMREMDLELIKTDLLRVSLVTDTGSVNDTNLALRSNGGAFFAGNTGAGNTGAGNTGAGNTGAAPLVTLPSPGGGSTGANPSHAAPAAGGGGAS